MIGSIHAWHNVVNIINSMIAGHIESTHNQRLLTWTDAGVTEAQKPGILGQTP
jgi:hypothetical protein